MKMEAFGGPSHHNNNKKYLFICSVIRNQQTTIQKPAENFILRKLNIFFKSFFFIFFFYCFVCVLASFSYSVSFFIYLLDIFSYFFSHSWTRSRNEENIAAFLFIIFFFLPLLWFEHFRIWCKKTQAKNEQRKWWRRRFFFYIILFKWVFAWSACFYFGALSLNGFWGLFWLEYQ